MSYVTIQGTAAVGLYLPSGGTITNPISGTIIDAIGVKIAGGYGVVINAGEIAGIDWVKFPPDLGYAKPGHGIFMLDGGSVSNESTGTILGGMDGVYIRGGSGAVANYGTIAAYDAYGGNAALGGIVLAAGGSVTNAAKASISGYNNGVLIELSAGTVGNAGTIAGIDAPGVVLSEGGVVTNAASGSIIGGQGFGVAIDQAAGTVINGGGITGTSEGVELGAGGYFANAVSASVTGRVAGVYIIGGSGTLANAGDIMGTAGFGVRLAIPGPVTLGSGAVNLYYGTISNAVLATISGSTSGVVVSGTATVINAGSIVGASGYGVELAAGDITNAASAVIAGSADGVEFNTAGTIFNDGSVSGATVDGIALQFGGYVSNASTGWISGYSYGVQIAGAPGIVVNDGGIAGTSRGGVVMARAAPGEVSNAASGSISGAYGVLIRGTGSVANRGTITGTSGDGVSMYAGSVGNTAKASIGGSSYGILIERGSGSVANDGIIAGTTSAGIFIIYYGSVSNTALGSIVGGTDGVDIDGAAATVVNGGGIAGTSGDGVGLRGGGYVSNASGGSISGLNNGIQITGAQGTVANAGVIMASTVSSTGRGIDLAVGGSVTNQSGGWVSGYDGIASASGAVTVVNAGSIVGNTIPPNGAGIVLSGGGNVINQSGGVVSGYDGIDGKFGALTLSNAGTIAGTQYAVLFSAVYGNDLVVDPGAVFSGVVSGGNPIGSAAISTLELASGAFAGTLSGIGTQFLDFGSIVFDPGADWFVSGNTAGLAGTISGFAAGDTLQLTGVTETGFSYVDGVLTLTEASGGATIDLSGTFALGQLQVSNVDGATDIVVGGTAESPAITGAASGQTVIESGAIPLFADVMVTDPNDGQTETVTVTMSNAANGTLGNLGGGTYNAATGVYAVSGSAAAVTAALDGLVFDPAAAGQTGFIMADTDTAGLSATNSATTVTAMAAPVIYNSSGGDSYVFTYYPIASVSETIQQFAGSDGTGALVTEIVDNTNGGSYLFAYNPTTTVTQTTQVWSATDTATGAPSGTVLADVVNNTDGTTLVYAYNPTSTVTQTAELWSATNVDGSAAGTPISDVVNNTDGTTLVYAYNPSGGVTQTTTEWSATNVDGSAAGTKISAVVDNTDGTSIVYAYNPTSEETQSAAYYSSYDPASGAPTGYQTEETIDYTAGLYSYQSSITTYDPSGAATGTTYYSEPDAAGTIVSSTIYASLGSADSGAISISGTGQVVDPGFGGGTIEFLPGASDDTLVLHTTAADTVSGFDPSAGDLLDLRSLFTEAGIDPAGAVANLSAYINVSAVGADAAVLFDPTGQGGGSAVATLVGDASLVPSLKAGGSFVV